LEVGVVGGLLIQALLRMGGLYPLRSVQLEVPLALPIPIRYGYYTQGERTLHLNRDIKDRQLEIVLKDSLLLRWDFPILQIHGSKFHTVS
jgi:hypothetical protein